jgi:hypothetical protein
MTKEAKTSVKFTGRLPGIPALGRLRQEFKVSFGSTVKHCHKKITG